MYSTQRAPVGSRESPAVPEVQSGTQPSMGRDRPPGWCPRSQTAPISDTSSSTSRYEAGVIISPGGEGSPRPPRRERCALRRIRATYEAAKHHSPSGATIPQTHFSRFNWPSFSVSTVRPSRGSLIARPANSIHMSGSAVAPPYADDLSARMISFAATQKQDRPHHADPGDSTSAFAPRSSASSAHAPTTDAPMPKHQGTPFRRCVKMSLSPHAVRKPSKVEPLLGTEATCTELPWRGSPRPTAWWIASRNSPRACVPCAQFPDCWCSRVISRSGRNGPRLQR